MKSKFINNVDSTGREERLNESKRRTNNLTDVIGSAQVNYDAQTAGNNRGD